MLILDSGNIFSRYRGLTIPSHNFIQEKTWLTAKAIVAGYNIMGCDGLNIAANDLVLGIEKIKELEGQANFPFISSNIMDIKNNKPLFKTHLLYDRGSFKIGIIGLTSEKYQNDQFTQTFPSLRIEDSYKAAKKKLAELEPVTDMIIVLSQLGAVADRNLADKLPAIDVIIGGNSGLVPQKGEIKDNTVIVQAERRGKGLGELRLNLKGKPVSITEGSNISATLERLDRVEKAIDSLKIRNERESEAYNRRQEQLMNRLLDEKKELEEEIAKFKNLSYFSHKVVKISPSINDQEQVGKILQGLRQDLKALTPPKPPKSK